MNRPAAYRPSTLTRPKAGSITWTPEMMRELDRCAALDLPVNIIEQRIGVKGGTLARGCLLRLRQLLPPGGGAE